MLKYNKNESLILHHHYHHHHHTQCIPLIKNYDQGLWREERRQFIPIKENAVKESLGLRKIFKGRENKQLLTKPTTYTHYDQ